jgi:hypothetical protein
MPSKKVPQMMRLIYDASWSIRLQDVIDRADSTTPTTPIYLEATKAGAVV